MLFKRDDTLIRPIEGLIQWFFAKRRLARFGAGSDIFQMGVRWRRNKDHIHVWVGKRVILVAGCLATILRRNAFSRGQIWVKHNRQSQPRMGVDFWAIYMGHTPTT